MGDPLELYSIHELRMFVRDVTGTVPPISPPKYKTELTAMLRSGAAVLEDRRPAFSASEYLGKLVKHAQERQPLADHF